MLTPLHLKPGRYNVRYSAHSARLDKTGSVYTDVTVPDFEKEKLSLSGVVVSGDPMPFAAPQDAFAGIIPVVPTTQREFEHSDRAHAFVRIYIGGRQPPGRVDVTARITDANAAAVAVKTDGVAAERFETKRSTDYTYDLPLARLAPGSYLLTIEARADAVTVRRNVRFSVK